MACSVAEGLRELWASDETLQEKIPALFDDDNRVFPEGYDLTGVPLPYAVFAETSVQTPASLGFGAVLDVRLVQLRIYSRSRQELLDVSKIARKLYGQACCIQTDQGDICHIKVDGGNSVLFPDGTRMVLHQMTLVVTDKQ